MFLRENTKGHNISHLEDYGFILSVIFVSAHTARKQAYNGIWTVLGDVYASAHNALNVSSDDLRSELVHTLGSVPLWTGRMSGRTQIILSQYILTRQVVPSQVGPIMGLGRG